MSKLSTLLVKETLIADWQSSAVALEREFGCGLIGLRKVVVSPTAMPAGVSSGAAENVLTDDLAGFCCYIG